MRKHWIYLNLTIWMIEEKRMGKHEKSLNLNDEPLPNMNTRREATMVRNVLKPDRFMKSHLPYLTELLIKLME